jgi:hypothetical protein
MKTENMKKPTFVRLLLTTGLLSALAPITTLRATPINPNPNLYVNAGVLGGADGKGLILEYTPTGTQSTFAAGLNSPRGLAFESGGNFFAASTTVGAKVADDQGSLLKFTPGGTQSNVGSTGSNFMEGVAIDGAGNDYVVGVNRSSLALASTIFKFTPGGTSSIFGTLPGQTFGLAFDSAGNLFAADASDQTIFKFTPGGTRSVFAGPTAFSSPAGTGPLGLAFNSAGDLFVSATPGAPGVASGTILEFTPGGTESTFVTGLDLPRGLAFDSAGNLFVAEPALGVVEEFTPGGTKTVFATGIPGGAQFLTFGPARAPVSTSVPDSGSTVMLLTISTLGLVCVRRMVKA